MLRFTAKEQRRSARARKSGTMFWRSSPTAKFNVGWLIEGSKDGLAFAWRGTRPPGVGTLLQVRTPSDDTEHDAGQVIVRRATTVHGDLTMIGAERIHLRPFPPAVIAEVKPQMQARHAGRRSLLAAA